ncbi:ankyrin repeat-containing protein At2g01680-like [Salvia miltiorrhiza]|uniref:ankyrin repeat-containing protein At2g01680-like n=1 Tax=Salvia miltiorrhiza TaxID=226208 RepID=UPI0025AB7BFE|nr:ankyrin repeat-containing protein At2g01680-like [Salvia miltiorrhiza]
MAGEVARRDLHVAATDGDVRGFLGLLQEDPYLLEEVSFACSRNLLHIAAMRGQVGIVREVLRINSQLARYLDSQKSSPLHIAAAQGNVEIVEELLLAAPEMCWWRDGQGMNPVHIAAMNGYVRILEVLIGVDPFPAAEKLDRGQTVLHLCLKHRQVKAFQLLVDKFGELVNVEDDDGEMVLHSAVRFRREEEVQYLVENHTTYELPTNSKGKTVQQISRESSQDTSVRIDEILSNRVSYSGKPTGFAGE